ncbi:hypothetical protein Y032_0431g1326 [Ancylostoma ceylanicum]|uniref:Uncharacterized protein n=1 Tax=Ancylostoma ceylanicum TaxID=53326 RepID=A0A016X253_9BILA|nr:hypothetical protein Y032_0431g1326 [Ancylostoma ceylanicum]
MMTWTARKRGCLDRLGGLVVSDRRFYKTNYTVCKVNFRLPRRHGRYNNTPTPTMMVPPNSNGFHAPSVAPMHDEDIDVI